jgi:hypothetical protein
MEKLPLDILKIIASFIIPKLFELNPLIDETKLTSYFLSINPCQKIIETIISKKRSEISRVNFYLLSKNPLDIAVDFLFNNQYWIDFPNLSINSNDRAVEFMLNNKNKIDWECFSENTNTRAVQYLIDHPSEINWKSFSKNTNEKAVDYMLSTEKTRKCINYKFLSENNNQKAVEHLIESHIKNHTEIYTKLLVKNKNNTAVDFIFKTIEPLNDRDKKIFFEQHHYIFVNTNDKIIDYLIKNPQYIKWEYFVRNTSHKAIEYMVLPKNNSKINWNMFSTNPSIFIEISHKKILDFALSIY